MNSKLIPVAVVLLVMIVASHSDDEELRPISEKFKSELCDVELNPDQVCSRLRSHSNQEELVDLISVKNLLLMEDIRPENCESLAVFKANCRLVRKSCPNVEAYCNVRYQQLSAICSTGDISGEILITAEFESMLCEQKLDTMEVSALLRDHPGQEEFIDLMRVEDLITVEKIEREYCEDLIMYKIICRFVSESCPNIINYCNHFQQRMEQLCDGSSPKAEEPTDTGAPPPPESV